MNIGSKKWTPISMILRWRGINLPRSCAKLEFSACARTLYFSDLLPRQLVSTFQHCTQWIIESMRVSTKWAAGWSDHNNAYECSCIAFVTYFNEPITCLPCGVTSNVPVWSRVLSFPRIYYCNVHNWSRAAAFSLRAITGNMFAVTCCTVFVTWYHR